MSTTESIDWSRFGISYDNNNNEDFDEFRQDFRNDFTDNSDKHKVNGESALRSFEPKPPQNSRHQWMDNDNNGNKLWPTSGQKPISLAVMSRRTLKVIPYKEENPILEPQIIEITSKPIPLKLHFKTHSSQLTVHQSLHSNPINKVEETSTHEEPYRMRHNVMKPVIQEVKEIIQPYRHFVQHIKPLIEDIKTIVSEKVDKHGGHPDQSPNTDHMTDNGAQHQHNSFDNHFNNDFGSNFRPNQDFQSRNLHNSIDFERKTDNFRAHPTQDMGRDFSASNPSKTYRFVPLMLRRSDISDHYGYGHQLPPQLRHVLTYLQNI